MTTNDNRSLTRRGVLKGTAGVSIATLGINRSIGLTSADTSKFEQGSVRFVEVVEEFNAPADLPKSGRHGTAGYCIDDERKRLTLTNFPADTFARNDVIVSSDGRPHAGRTIPISKVEREIAVDAGYRHLGATYCVLDQPLPRAPLSLTKAENRVNLGTESLDLTIPDGDQAQATQKITIPDSGDVEINRTIKARNHGQMTVYGHDDYLVFPLDSNDDYAQARVSSLLALVEDDAEEYEETDLLAVPKDIDITKGQEGGDIQ